MPAQFNLANLRRVAVIGALLLVGLTTGCAMWHPDSWNLDRYRDERAVEIEGHLSREDPIVVSPF